MAYIPGMGSSGAAVAPGVVGLWTLNSVPSGWLLCDGSAVSRTTYAALFAVLGTTYGAGDGSTTFNLPSFADVYPKLVTGDPTSSPTGGAATHNHGAVTGAPSATINAFGGATPVGRADHTHSISSDSNEPPYNKIRAIIKT